MKAVTLHHSPGIYLTAEENPGKLQLGIRLKVVRPVIASYRVRYLQMMSVGSHGTLRKDGGQDSCSDTLSTYS